MAEGDVQIPDQGLVIDGQVVPGKGSATFETVNPSTGRPLARLVRGGAAEIDAAVRSSRKTFESKAWREMPHADRGRLLSKLAELIRRDVEELARLESTDVGKPISQARGDIRTTARYFEYYGGMADKIMGNVIPVRWGVLDLTLREPYGVSAQIIPWNFPAMMGARGIAPALAAGNCVVAKPAEEASLSILRLGRLASEAGFPAGAFNVVTGLGPEAGAALVRHPGVNHVTFTGSVETGTEVMKGAAEGIKPVALELGGKSPNIVFADCDLDAASVLIARSILLNAGQTCNACTRLLVEAKVHDELLARVRNRFDAAKMGAPLDDPDLGPLISAGQRDRVDNYLKIARAEGAEITRHGALPSDGALAGGFYTQPTILDKVGASARVFREEIFGPVLAVTAFTDAEEALSLANATDYGLVTGIWTRDVSRALTFAHRVQAGQIYINGYGTGGSVEVPFGGYKKSGFGREKGYDGLLHYTQIKSISAHFA